MHNIIQITLVNGTWYALYRDDDGGIFHSGQPVIAWALYEVDGYRDVGGMLAHTDEPVALCKRSINHYGYIHVSEDDCCIGAAMERAGYSLVEDDPDGIPVPVDNVYRLDRDNR
jgi:hypothetical protein